MVIRRGPGDNDLVEHLAADVGMTADEFRDESGMSEQDPAQDAAFAASPPD